MKVITTICIEADIKEQASKQIPNLSAFVEDALRKELMGKSTTFLSDSKEELARKEAELKAMQDQITKAEQEANETTYTVLHDKRCIERLKIVKANPNTAIPNAKAINNILGLTLTPEDIIKLSKVV